MKVGASIGEGQLLREAEWARLLAPAGGEPFALLAALLQGSGSSADWFEAAPGSNETVAAAC